MMETEIRATVRNLLLSLVDRCESPIEEAFLSEWADACGASTCPLADLARAADVHPQFQIDDYRTDFAFPQSRLVIELDGHDFHASKESRTNDAQRDRALHLAGWTVLRFTGTELTANPAACINDAWRAVIGSPRHEAVAIQRRATARPPAIRSVERLEAYAREQMKFLRSAPKPDRLEIFDRILDAVCSFMRHRCRWIPSFETAEEHRDFDSAMAFISACTGIREQIIRSRASDGRRQFDPQISDTLGRIGA